MENKVGKIVGIILLVLLIIYGAGAAAFSQVYMPYTYINGKDVSFQKRKDYPERFQEEWKNHELTIEGKNGRKDFFPATEIDYDVKVKDFENIYQNPLEWPYLAFLYKDYKINADIQYDRNKLEEKYRSLHVVSDEDITEPSPAHIGYEPGTGYVVKEPQEGDRVQDFALKKAILTSLYEQKPTLNLEEADLYLKPGPAAEPIEKMKRHVERLNEIESFTLTYDFEDRQEVLAGENLINLYAEDEEGNLIPDEEKVAEYVDYLSETYDTFKGERQFQKTGGGVVLVKGGIYGWRIQREETAAQLEEAMRVKQPQVLKPIYDREAQSRAVNDIGNSYVEIDLSRQHLWVYKDGDLAHDTSIVTGNPYAGNGTPTGTDMVWSKEENRILKGPTWESFVKYWMPINWRGIGLHDASWRGRFGEGIYRGSGSHGCINLPPSVAKEIYDSTFIGMPVIVYDSAKQTIE